LRKQNYLRGVDLPHVDVTTLTLLVGANFPEALQDEVVRNGTDGFPDSVRTPLGWSLLGPVFKAVAPPDNGTSCFVVHVSATVPQSSIEQFLMS